MDAKNKLYFGDNLKILREYVPQASVDLIYLDPPLNSSATDGFFVAPTFRSAQRDAHLKVGATPSGEESAAQIMASPVAPIYDRRLLQEERTGGHRPPLQQEAEAVHREIVERGPGKLADLMQALLAFSRYNALR